MFGEGEDLKVVDLGLPRRNIEEQRNIEVENIEVIVVSYSSFWCLVLSSFEQQQLPLNHRL